MAHVSTFANAMPAFAFRAQSSHVCVHVYTIVIQTSRPAGSPGGVELERTERRFVKGGTEPSSTSSKDSSWPQKHKIHKRRTCTNILMCVVCLVVLSVTVLFIHKMSFSAFNLSFSGHSHLGSVFTNEELKSLARDVFRHFCCTRLTAALFMMLAVTDSDTDS